MNPFTAVGRKLISLEACSILTVYRGVCTGEGEAPTLAATTNARTTPTAAISNHFCTLSNKIHKVKKNFYFLCMFLQIPFHYKLQSPLRFSHSVSSTVHSYLIFSIVDKAPVISQSASIILYPGDHTLSSSIHLSRQFTHTLWASQRSVGH